MSGPHARIVFLSDFTTLSGAGLCVCLCCCKLAISIFNFDRGKQTKFASLWANFRVAFLTFPN